MKFYFIRHGQTDWNVAKKIQGKTDIDLNAEGIKQAEKLGDDLLKRDYGIRTVYTSRLKRAFETAAIIGKKLNVECVILDGVEEVDLGLWEGLSWGEVREKFPEEFSIWHERRGETEPPQGESYMEMLARVLKALKYLKEKNEGDVAVVTHSAVIMALQSYINETPFENMAQYKAANTSVVMVEGERLRLN